jgi:hypothetical protein
MSLKGLGKRNSMLASVDYRSGRDEDFSKGFSDKNVSSLFQNYLGSGLIKGNEDARKLFIETLRSESLSGNPDAENVNMNYSGGPNYNPGDYDKKESSSPWVPNTTSPDINGQRIDSAQEDRYTEKRGAAPYEGLGTLLDPAQSATDLTDKKLTLGEYIKGRRPGRKEK